MQRLHQKERADSIKECLQIIPEMNEKGSGCINKFHMDQLKMLLWYYYDDDIYKKKGTWKLHWVEAVTKHYEQQ
eukprot:4932277-Ditylum_brightwellii.AAC.1